MKYPATFLLIIFLAFSSDAQYAEKFKYETAKVSWVIDGDTFVTNSGERVRLIGIDTPEMNGPNSRKAKTAKKYLKDLILYREVILEYDRQQRGPYGRLLAYVQFDGTLVNCQLLRTGLAEIMTVRPNTKYLRTLKNCSQ